MKQFALRYNRDYGIDKRTGWSVSIDGIVWVEFASTAIGAIVTAFWRRWRLRETESAT